MCLGLAPLPRATHRPQRRPGDCRSQRTYKLQGRDEQACSEAGADEALSLGRSGIGPRPCGGRHWNDHRHVIGAHNDVRKHGPSSTVRRRRVRPTASCRMFRQQPRRRPLGSGANTTEADDGSPLDELSTSDEGVREAAPGAARGRAISGRTLSHSSPAGAGHDSERIPRRRHEATVSSSVRSEALDVPRGRGSVDRRLEESRACSTPSSSQVLPFCSWLHSLCRNRARSNRAAHHRRSSPATARTNVFRAMVKPGARDRAQLVVFAYQSGLV